MHCGRFHRRCRLSRAARCSRARPTVLARWRWRRWRAIRPTAQSPARGDGSTRLNPLAPRRTHFPAKAKSVIFLFMDGGPSQVDTFDPKPRLAREHGQPIKMKVQPTQFDNVGKVLKSPWKFRQYGESGIPVSDLFPHVATCVDDLAIVRSMVANFSEHTNANYFLHSGHGQQGRPSMGAWVTYGLGSECQNLPGFVVLNSGMIPPGGWDCFDSGFLPATYQGSSFQRGEQPRGRSGRAEASAADCSSKKLDLMRALDRAALERSGHRRQARSGHRQLRAGLPHADGRARTDGPGRRERGDASSSTASTTRRPKLFGRAVPARPAAGRARRAVRRAVVPEPGARPLGPAQQPARRDTPTTPGRPTSRSPGLLKDLKARGLLDETLVVWGGEFGRTPMAQGTDGRDHNPFGFTMWLAGGGIKGGTIYGATDDYGYYAVENKVEVHDLHATMLHLLGIDHKRLTYRFGGRDMRLTDVHGEVIKDILA